MCSITGCAGFKDVQLIESMNRAASHRGPDDHDEIIYQNPPIALGHNRLSILDISDAAHQPFLSKNRKQCLVFNGEIYNYRELRKDLESKGVSFKSTGDTEVLFESLKENKTLALQQLNGIYAFAYYDSETQELLLARDPLGVKPLYYAQPKPGLFLFASEMKSLFAYPGLSKELDYEALQQYLGYCYSSGDRTPFKAVRRLTPGHYLRYDLNRGQFQIKPFWLPRFGDETRLDYRTSLEELRAQLDQAVERQLVSDVPVGILLSGGLDSSLVGALAARHQARGIKSFTVFTPSSENKLDQYELDQPYARQLAEELHFDHREIELTPRLTELLPKLVWHLDEPLVDPAVISMYLMCQSARETGVKVLLTGQGADELFCGYPRYMVMYWTQGIAALPAWARRAISGAAQSLPGSSEGPLGGFLRRIRRGLSGFDLSTEARFLSYCANTSQSALDRVLSPGFKAELSGKNFMDDDLASMTQTSLKGMVRFQKRDMEVYLPNHNLHYTDRMSMAAGVEARVPLLDLELVERVLKYPYAWQLKGGKTKAILRDASRGIVPDRIIDRPKAGLGAPYRKWLRYDLAELWNDLTSESVVKRRGWFDHSALQEARRSSQEGREDLYMLQWAALTMELWARQYIDAGPPVPKTEPVVKALV